MQPTLHFGSSVPTTKAAKKILWRKLMISSNVILLFAVKRWIVLCGHFRCCFKMQHAEPSKKLQLQRWCVLFQHRVPQKMVGWKMLKITMSLLKQSKLHKPFSGTTHDRPGLVLKPHLRTLELLRRGPHDAKWGKMNHRHGAIDVHMGVSENSVPLNQMVNDHYPY